MTIPIAIDDPSDPRIAAYRAIRERDLIGREGLFIAEGEVVVRMLFTRSIHPPVSLLVAEKRVAALAGLIAGLSARSVGVLGKPGGDGPGRRLPDAPRDTGARPVRPDAAVDALLAGAGPRATVVVLFGIANHDNIGGIFRNAAAFGAGAVLLDSDCCDPLYRKAIRVSVGAALTVPFARLGRGEDALALLSAHGFEAVALSPGGVSLLSEIRPPDRVAVLFGTEGVGLPQSILARVQSVRIPMAGELDSLNVATASGIVLHHLTFGGL